MEPINLMRPDDELEALLLNRENILLLEHLLEKEGKLFAGLERLKRRGELDFGKEMVKMGICDEFKEGAVEEAYNILEKVQPKVNKFLRTKKVDFLKTGEIVLTEKGIGGGYDPDGPTIIVEMTNIVDLTTGLAHEYAHHVQYSVLPHFLKKDKNKYRMFKEGHARGVERYISKLYNEREANKAFLHNITNRNLYELLSAYKWVCFALGVEPSANVINYGECLSDEGKKCPLDSWTKGNALFYIHETLHGDGIYRKALER